jgi:hypothetical protein
VVVGVSVLAADLGQMVGDGVNLYQYCRGNPLLGSDPTGLFYQGLFAYGQVMSRAGETAVNLVSEYSANLEADIDWAMDWSLPDDMYSRAHSSEWVNDIMGGMVGGMVEDLADEVLPGSSLLFASGGGAQASIADGVKTIFKIGTRGGKVMHKGWKHHVLPRYLAKWIKSVHNPQVLMRLPVALHREYHTFVDKWFRDKYPGFPAMSTRNVNWKNLNRDYPDIIDKIPDELMAATRAFEKAKGISGLSDALRFALTGK